MTFRNIVSLFACRFSFILGIIFNFYFKTTIHVFPSHQSNCCFLQNPKFLQQWIRPQSTCFQCLSSQVFMYHLEVHFSSSLCHRISLRIISKYEECSWKYYKLNFWQPICNLAITNCKIWDTGTVYQPIYILLYFIIMPSNENGWFLLRLYIYQTWPLIK